MGAGTGGGGGGSGGSGGDDGGGGGGDGAGDVFGDILAHWLAETALARADLTGRRIWRLYESDTFADEWYRAREVGEQVRASVLAALYANRPHPGGRHPDPRAGASFSALAVLGAVARGLGMVIRQMSQSQAQPHGGADGADDAPTQPLPTMRQSGQPGQPGQPAQPWVLLLTYPRSRKLAQTLYMREETPAAPQARLYFELACLIGYIYRESHHLLDPDAPPGTTYIPNDPSMVTILHQFAIALLHLPQQCPAGWTCHCNIIRRRFNMPPGDHDQPTDTLTLAELAQEPDSDRL